MHKLAKIITNKVEFAVLETRILASDGHLVTSLIVPRHDCLAEEIARRGIRHLDALDNYRDTINRGSLLNTHDSLNELIDACADCRTRYVSAQARRRARKTRVTSAV